MSRISRVPADGASAVRTVRGVTPWLGQLPTISDGPAPAARPTRSRTRRASVPRVVCVPPRDGFFHPVTSNDVLEALALAGEESASLLRVVTLGPPSVGASASHPGPFVRWTGPSTLMLHALPPGPWELIDVPAAELPRWQSAGARIEILAGGATKVYWQPGGLRDFILYDVLLRELDKAAGKAAAKRRAG